MGDFVPNSAQVDVLLTDLAKDAINDASKFIAEQLLPTHTVPKRSGVYFTYDGEELRIEDDTHADGESVNEVSNGLSQTSYGPIKDYGFMAKATRDAARELGSELAEKNAMMRAMHGVLLGRDNRLAASMTDTGVMTNNVTLSTSADRWDQSTSDPIGVFRAGKVAIFNALGVMPNTAVIPFEVYTYLEVHPQLVSRLNGIASTVSQEQMAKILGVEKIIVPVSRKNSAVQGATNSIASVWGKNAWLMYIAPEAPQDREYVTFGHTLRVEGEAAETTVSKWEDPNPTKHTTWVAVETAYEHMIMAADAAYFMKTVIS